jgi:ceramide glucosyltransferase
MSLPAVLDVLGVLVAIMALAGAGFGLMAAIATARFLARTPAAPVSYPSVTIIRPMRGAEPEFDDNFASLLHQDYAGPVQVLAGADSEADPAYVAATRHRAAHKDADIALVADPAQHGTNRKLSNLINMAPRITSEVVVISDSDVRLPPGGLSALIGALQQPGIGLVYSLYRGRPAGNVWSRMAALDINARFASSVVAGQALGAHPVLGPTMAVRRDVLERAGGFERLKDVLADDFELGRMVREQGFGIGCPPLLIDHVFPERTLGELFVHELRWARTIRLLNPGGYAGSVITFFWPLALLAAALTGFTGPVAGLFWALTAVRMIHAVWLCRLMRADLSVVWLFPVRDLLALAVFAKAWFGDRIEWRGSRLRVKADGAMAQP